MFTRTDVCRELNEGAGTYEWLTASSHRALSRADDVQSLHAVHLSALTLNPPFSSFLPTPDRGFSPEAGEDEL